MSFLVYKLSNEQEVQNPEITEKVEKEKNLKRKRSKYNKVLDSI